MSRRRRHGYNERRRSVMRETWVKHQRPNPGRFAIGGLDDCCIVEAVKRDFGGGARGLYDLVPSAIEFDCFLNRLPHSRCSLFVLGIDCQSVTSATGKLATSRHTARQRRACLTISCIGAACMRVDYGEIGGNTTTKSKINMSTVRPRVRDDTRRRLVV